MSSRIFQFLSWIIVTGFVILGVGIVTFYSQQTASRKAVLLPTVTPAFKLENGFAAADLPSYTTSKETASIERSAQLHTYRPEEPRFGVKQYTVVKGDTAWTIAKKFGIKPETILWATEGLSGDAGTLKIGTILNILPIDGVYHTVRAGDSIQQISESHGVPVNDIVEFLGNDFGSQIPDDLVEGSHIIVPGGTKPAVWQELGPRVVAGQGRKSPGYYSGPLVNNGTGNFSWPVYPIVITQPYWSGHSGIDIDTYPRQPIFASDSGTVIFADWDKSGFGFLVIVDHGNGYWTYYGHNTANLVRVGQGVVKGQQIAESGSTGNSTGDHIDFRIRLAGGGFVNPANFLP